MSTTRSISGRIAGLALSAAALAGLAFAPAAKADPVENYAAIVAPAVCATLDEYPSFAGIEGVAQFIVKDSGATHYEAGRVIGISVYGWCDRHAALIQRYAGTHTQKQVRA